MKFAGLLVAALVCSGCCCNGMEFTDKEPWKLAVLNESANPQVVALDAGTANVFEIEVSYPRGWTQADYDAAVELQARREVKRLQRLIHAGGPDEEPETVAPRELERSFTVRFIVLNPDAAGERGFVGADCAACVPESSAHHAALLRTSGLAPVDLHKLTREQLMNGVELSGLFNFASPVDAKSMRLGVLPGGRAMLRLIESCKANVLLVDKKVETSPRKFEEQSWFELRDTPCAGDAMTTREIVGPQFSSSGPPPSQKMIELLEKQLDEVGIAH